MLPKEREKERERKDELLSRNRGDIHQGGGASPRVTEAALFVIWEKYGCILQGDTIV